MTTNFAVFALSLFFSAANALSEPQLAPTESEARVNWIKHGSGTFRWFGIKIYQATLLVDSKFNGDYKLARPIALEIQYDIDIDYLDLIETTKDEWSELALGRSDFCQSQNLWLESLKSVWPNLKQGDRLKLVVDKTQVSQFYHNDQAIGQIEDSKFGTCFLAIWLEKDSSAPSLRKKLLNL